MQVQNQHPAKHASIKISVFTLQHRGIEVFIPNRFIPPGTRELLYALNKADITHSEQLYTLLDTIKAVVKDANVEPLAVSLALAVTLSNYAIEFSAPVKHDLIEFYQSHGFALVYDRCNGLFTPNEWLQYPPKLFSSEERNIALH